MRWHVGFGCALILLLAAPVAGLAQCGRYAPLRGILIAACVNRIAPLAEKLSRPGCPLPRLSPSVGTGFLGS